MKLVIAVIKNFKIEEVTEALQELDVPGVTLTVTRRPGYLMMHWSTQADSTLVPVGPNEFLDRSFWARVGFTPGPDGRPSRLVWIYSDKEYPAARKGAGPGT